VIIDGQMSDWAQVTSGVPKGLLDHCCSLSMWTTLILILPHPYGFSESLMTAQFIKKLGTQLMQQDLYKLYHLTQTW